MTVYTTLNIFENTMKPFYFVLLLEYFLSARTDTSLFVSGFVVFHPSSKNLTSLPLSDNADNVQFSTSAALGKHISKEGYEQNSFLRYSFPSKHTAMGPFLDKFDKNDSSVFDIQFDDDSQFWDFITNLYSDVCRTTCNNFMLEGITNQECQQCRCDEACHVYNDCCPEVYIWNVKHISNVSVSCLATTFPDRGNVTPGFLMVADCPEQNTSLSLQCSNSSRHWNFTQPVTDTIHLGLTYKNKFCAQCWDISEYVRWQPRVLISDPSSVDRRMSSEELFFLMVKGESGSLNYSPPPEIETFRTRSCTTDFRTHVIATCNETGMWPQWQGTANKACLSLNLPFRVKDEIYGNVFCYFCNSPLTWDEILHTRPPYTSERDDPVNSLTILLDLDETSDAEWEQEKSEQCNDQQVYDFHKNICVQSECVPGKRRTGNKTCSSVFKQSNVYGYSLCFTMPGNGSIIHRVLDTSDSVVSSNITRLGLYPVHLNIQTNSCFDSLKDRFNVSVAPSSVASSSVTIDFVLAEPYTRDALDNLIKSRSVNEILSQDIVEEITSSYGITAFHKIPLCHWPEDNYKSEMVNDFPWKKPLKSGHSLNLCQNQTDTDIVHYIPKSIYKKIKKIKESTIYLPMVDLLLCQFFVLEKGEYELNSNDWTISLHLAKVTIFANRTNINAYGNLRVCVNDYQPSGSRSQPESKDIHDRIISWMSLVCTIISMFSCSLTFVTYCLFKTLRSSAGLNNMILCMNLFFSQGLVQFGGNQTESKEVCTILAILTHFFSLSSMTCMTTCTFHMMYALAFPFRFQSHHGNDWAAIKPYIAAAICVPSLLVAATITINQLDDGSTGYVGSGDCFVNHGITKQLFFALPIATLVLFNLGMYFFTIVHLKRMPKLGENHNDKKKLGLYTRLSVITGVFWIFGFLYEFTKCIVFAYLYILTSPLIGLFIFLAFVVNPRVLELAKGRLRGKETISRKATPQITKSQQITGKDSGRQQTIKAAANPCSNCKDLSSFEAVFQKDRSANGVSSGSAETSLSLKEKPDSLLIVSVRL